MIFSGQKRIFTGTEHLTKIQSCNDEFPISIEYIIENFM